MNKLVAKWLRRVFAAAPLNRFFCWRVASGGGRVAITLDDGPTENITPLVLEALAGAGVRATFFVLGEAVERTMPLVERIAAAGHEIGIHGFDHTQRDLRAQVRRCAAVLAAQGIATRLFRPPGGRLSVRNALWLAASGYTTVLWSFDTHDSMRCEGKWSGDAPDYAVVKDGDIVLMHDDTPVCVAELPVLLNSLAKKGLRSVTVSELLGSVQ